MTPTLTGHAQRTWAAASDPKGRAAALAYLKALADAEDDLGNYDHGRPMRRAFDAAEAAFRLAALGCPVADGDGVRFDAMITREDVMRANG